MVSEPGRSRVFGVSMTTAPSSCVGMHKQRERHIYLIYDRGALEAS